MLIDYLPEEKKFLATATFDERMPLKAARFRWDPNGNDCGRPKTWWTDDPKKAVKLYDHLSAAARREVDGMKREMDKALAASRAADADVEVPAPDGYDYIPFQRGGIAFGLGAFGRDMGLLIGDEMGLGKTIQALGLLNATPGISKVLVICPASLKINWSREADRWLVDRELAKAVKVVDGKTVLYPGERRFWIVNYDILQQHHAALTSMKWDLLVADECHYMKNQTTLRTKHVMGWKPGKKDLAKWSRACLVAERKGNPKPPEPQEIPAIEATRKVGLTGTPIPNRPIEGFSIFSWLAPQVFSSFWSYVTTYCNAHQNRYGWDMTGASNLDQLQHTLRTTIMVRRLKSEVLPELPAKMRQVIELAPNGASRAIEAEQKSWARYQDRLVELRAAVELAKASDSKEEYEKAVRALREGLSAAFTEMSKARHLTALAKVKHVIDHVKDSLDEEGHKVVLFAHHTDVVDAYMKEFGAVAVRVTGRDSKEARQVAVDRFQNDPSVRLFVGNIQAAGVGLTLTASSHVVFAELDWVPGNMTQAEDRCHRIGQRDNVLVQHLVLEGSLDAVMAHRLVEKQNVIDRALDEMWAADGGMFKQIPVLPTKEKAATESATRKKLEAEAEKLTDVQIAAIHEGLQLLAAACDGALSEDSMGFNKLDTRIGKSLAAAPSLSRRQAALGKKLVNKYRRQLDPGLVARAKGE